ncbi:hypothetical protein LDI01_19320 [Lentilactobacillus diolivorans]|uniref:Uncharacterized protein n=1 Tax=Lentilactobacillus diolivorans TaxID=179838 RepID=A0ABQ0XJD7_9LACO|nr:hypothetical protein LDI01_19320 [Lentilactobacillus diolivorans]
MAKNHRDNEMAKFVNHDSQKAKIELTIDSKSVGNVLLGVTIKPR